MYPLDESEQLRHPLITRVTSADMRLPGGKELAVVGVAQGCNR
jgi:hypothetical protein